MVTILSLCVLQAIIPHKRIHNLYVLENYSTANSLLEEEYSNSIQKNTWMSLYVWSISHHQRSAGILDHFLWEVFGKVWEFPILFWSELWENLPVEVFKYYNILLLSGSRFNIRNCSIIILLTWEKVFVKIKNNQHDLRINHREKGSDNTTRKLKLNTSNRMATQHQWIITLVLQELMLKEIYECN